jgi:DNA-binding MarR family transcriptional regulator
MRVDDDESGPDLGVRAFARMFEQTYLRFHRRDERRSAMSGTARAVLLHLARTGPLTVSEAARHLDRAQSVVSDIVTHLETKGLLERQADPDDGRRTLVWLTPDGFDHLERDREVLAGPLLARALAAMDPRDREALLTGFAALLAADDDAARHTSAPLIPTHPRPRPRPVRRPARDAAEATRTTHTPETTQIEEMP